MTSLLIGSSSFLQAKNSINSWMGWKYGQIGPWTVELAALERLENLHRLIMGEMLLSNLNGSLFVQTRRTTIKAWMSLNFVKIPSPIMELAPLEHLKN